MNMPRAVVSLLAAAAVIAAASLAVLSVGSAPNGSPPTPATAPRVATPQSAGGPSPASGAAPEAGVADQSFGQLLRSTERATIRQAVVDHEPMARGTVVRLAVEVEIVPGMHVNANPPSHEWLIPVEASVAGVEGIGVLEAFYPEAMSRKFPYSEEPFLVYEGAFVIGLTLAVDAGIPAGRHALEVVLDYQACNDEACFAPAVTSSELPVTVVADVSDATPVTSRLLERAPFRR